MLIYQIGQPVLEGLNATMFHIIELVAHPNWQIFRGKPKAMLG